MYYLGLDIGGTKTAISLGKISNDNLEIINRKEVKTLESPYDTLNALSSDIDGWVKEYGVKYAGVSCGGPLDSKTGVIVSTPNLSKQWHGFKVTEYLKENFNLVAKLENDANACAVAEWMFGAGRNSQNMIFLTFGTGLGAGLILDGKLYSGTNGNAGEIGHVRLTKDGPFGFNKHGSAEGYCSGNGIKSLALIRAKEKNIEIDQDITTKTIFEKAISGDEFFFGVVRESAEAFGTVLAILIDLFNPEVIVAGGVFMRNYELFMSLLNDTLVNEALVDSLKVCKILPAQIGENIGDYAAIALAKSIKE